MEVFQTMTVTGARGLDIEAYSTEEAVTIAEETHGYSVLDTMDLVGATVLVIS